MNDNLLKHKCVSDQKIKVLKWHCFYFDPGKSVKRYIAEQITIISIEKLYIPSCPLIIKNTKGFCGHPGPRKTINIFAHNGDCLYAIITLEWFYLCFIRGQLLPQCLQDMSQIWNIDQYYNCIISEIVNIQL